MKRINNKKGFTLMELLAVIVILSVLILLAMPAVLRLMENARKNAFITEANSIIKIAQTAYADQSTTGTAPTCYKLSDLKTGGYTDKNFATDGSVGITTTATSTTYTLWYSNGSYSITNKTFDSGYTVSSLDTTVVATPSTTCGAS